MRFLHDLYCFVRFSAFGATAALPLLGAALAGRELSPRRLARLLGVAAAFHVFAYVDNDLCDLELDRSQPLRSFYPLVRGAIRPATARAISLGAIGAAFLIAGDDQQDNSCTTRQSSVPLFSPSRFSVLGSWLPVRGSRFAILSAAFVLMTIYNRYGKRCPVPPLTDAVQGLGWAALIAYGADGRVSRPVALLMLHELFLILLVNGVHGPLRDLANDAQNGARTTALWLGATASPSGSPRMSPALLAYGLALQVGMAGSLSATLYAAGPTLPRRVRRAAAGGLVGCFALTTALIGVAARSRAPARIVGMLHLILILSAPIALAAPAMPGHARNALLLAHVVPLLVNGLTYDALRWLVTLNNEL